MNQELLVWACGMIAIAVGAAVSYWAKGKLRPPNTLTFDPVFLAVFIIVWFLGMVVVGVVRSLFFGPHT